MKILVFLLLIPMTAIAADWVLIGADQNTELEIDKQSVRPNKAAWFKYIYTPPTVTGCETNAEKTEYSKNYVEANCKEFTIRTKQLIAYSESEEVLDSCGVNDTKSRFVEYAPETLGELYFKAICDPKSRVKSKYAEYLRKRKAAKFKPLFSECATSSECAGSMLCLPVGTSSTMRCSRPSPKPK